MPDCVLHFLWSGPRCFYERLVTGPDWAGQKTSLGAPNQHLHPLLDPETTHVPDCVCLFFHFPCSAPRGLANPGTNLVSATLVFRFAIGTKWNEMKWTETKWKTHKAMKVLAFWKAFHSLSRLFQFVFCIFVWFGVQGLGFRVWDFHVFIFFFLFFIFHF